MVTARPRRPAGPEPGLRPVRPPPRGRARRRAPAPDLGPEPENLVLRAIAAARARDPGRRRRPAAPGPGRPPREADPGGRGPCGRLVGRRGRPRRGARGVGRRRTSWTRRRARPSPRSLGSDCPFFLAGGWAARRGPRRARDRRCRRRAATPPGVVLVTPAVAVSTPAVFERYAAGIRPAGGAALASSTLPRRRAAGRAVDRPPPGARRRPRGRQRPGPGRPPTSSRPSSGPAGPSPGCSSARSASRAPGPTLWALSPSKADALGDAAIVRAALADGLLAAPGRAGRRSSPRPPSSASGNAVATAHPAPSS